MDNPTNKDISSDNNVISSDLLGNSGIDISENNQSNSGIIRTSNGRFGKGTAPGPGRTKGKTLKEWRRETLANMTDEERLEFLKSVSNETQWKMAEGNPPTVIAGDKDNPLRIITVDKDLANIDGITISPTEDNSDRQD